MSIWEQPSPESSSPAPVNPGGSESPGPGGPMPASVPRPDPVTGRPNGSEAAPGESSEPTAPAERDAAHETPVSTAPSAASAHAPDVDGGATGALPTMADLDVLGRELDAVDATLVALDARTLDVPSSDDARVGVEPGLDADVADKGVADDRADDRADDTADERVAGDGVAEGMEPGGR